MSGTFGPATQARRKRREEWLKQQIQEANEWAREARKQALPDCLNVFKKWLGDEYDLDAIKVTLCALAVEQLDGEPLWLLIVSGPGAAKTETVQAARGAGAWVESTISSDAALLSGSPARDTKKNKNATGGLLRKIGDRGVLVIKDFTSILSGNRDQRQTVLAALREIYDGYWSRNLGTDGGTSLSWSGRIAVIGAVTTAWDSAHSVIATMGDRFTLCRIDSNKGRQAAGLRTANNTGNETIMRKELADAVKSVIKNMDHEADLDLTEAETEQLLAAADLVTLARTGVEHDYAGNVVGAHAPEMPTRFLRQLQQIVRGAISIGLDRREGMRLAIRCARDSLPPVRMKIIDNLSRNPDSTVRDIRQRVNMPKTTVDRQCQGLHMLGVLDVNEVEVAYGTDVRSRWFYRLAEGIDPETLGWDGEGAGAVSSPPTDPDLSETSTGDSKIHIPLIGTRKTLTDKSGSVTGNGALLPLPSPSPPKDYCDRCGMPLDKCANRKSCKEKRS